MDIQIVAPEAGTDYPGSWTEFLDWFGSEAAFLAYLSGCAGHKDSCALAAVWPVSPIAPVEPG